MKEDMVTDNWTLDKLFQPASLQLFATSPISQGVTGAAHPACRVSFIRYYVTQPNLGDLLPLGRHQDITSLPVDHI